MLGLMQLAVDKALSSCCISFTRQSRVCFPGPLPSEQLGLLYAKPRGEGRAQQGQNWVATGSCAQRQRSKARKRGESREKLEVLSKPPWLVFPSQRLPSNMCTACITSRQGATHEAPTQAHQPLRAAGSHFLKEPGHVEALPPPNGHSEFSSNSMTPRLWIEH